MKFSILTPSYGYGRFLSDCIASVLRQEDVALEHIVMDGGSQDDTLQVLSSFGRDPRLVWRSEPDRGQSDALTKALQSATGDWIGWLNADEFYLDRTLSHVREAIRADPAVDLIHGDYAEVDQQGRLIRLVSQHAYSPRTLRARCYIPSCATFFRRSALPQVPWDARCISMMDWELFLRLAGLGRRFTHVRRALGAFRVHKEQITQSAVAQSNEEFDLIRSRHDIPLGGMALRRVRVAGRSAHIMRKAVEGGYRREARAWRARGRSLRWFADAGVSHEGSVL